MALARDSCVVPTEPLAELLSGWVTRWRAERPSTAGRFAPAQQRTEVPFVGPVEYLVQETRQHDPDGHGVSASTIERIMGRRTQMTGLRTADCLVSALDCPQVWHDGTLEIQPNPAASASQQATCCGGSFTGGLSEAFWGQLAACVRTAA